MKYFHWWHSFGLTLLALLHEDIRDFVKELPKAVIGYFKKEKIMDIKEIIADVQLAEQVLPELEAFYAAGKALYEKVESLKAKAEPPKAA